MGPLVLLGLREGVRRGGRFHASASSWLAARILASPQGASGEPVDVCPIAEKSQGECETWLGVAAARGFGRRGTVGRSGGWNAEGFDAAAGTFPHWRQCLKRPSFWEVLLVEAML